MDDAIDGVNRMGWIRWKLDLSGGINGVNLSILPHTDPTVAALGRRQGCPAATGYAGLGRDEVICRSNIAAASATALRADGNKRQYTQRV